MIRVLKAKTIVKADSYLGQQEKEQASAGSAVKTTEWPSEDPPWKHARLRRLSQAVDQFELEVAAMPSQDLEELQETFALCSNPDNIYHFALKK